MSTPSTGPEPAVNISQLYRNLMDPIRREEHQAITALLAGLNDDRLSPEAFERAMRAQQAATAHQSAQAWQVIADAAEHDDRTPLWAWDAARDAHAHHTQTAERLDAWLAEHTTTTDQTRDRVREEVCEL